MRKRSRYRPREVMNQPPSWGLTREAQVNLGVKEREALDALLTGAGTAVHYLTLEGACEVAIWACDEASVPVYGLDPDGLSQLRERLVHCARALLGVRDRARQLGRYGCNGPQREDLRELCERLHDMRMQIPRRALLAAYDRAMRSAGVVITR